ncbi:circadian clock-controlled protein daywake-like [Plodia interpunctella]|uniref:circadian clock-controlled protein daywake-like n=1 Tax=Plodia interpunctella TaxID=58824 RepID=UPI0023679FB8|nr:circadian clock-controlled protein daywake-like [Plodia interpunctella]
MIAFTSLSVAVFLVSSAAAAVLPNVGKCSLEDQSCLLKEFQNAIPSFFGGIPEDGIEVMDVMDVDEVSFELSGLHFGFTEGKLKGLKGTVIRNVDWNSKKHRITVDFISNCTLKGHYSASGQVLILPITGDGQLKLKLRDINVKLNIDYDLKVGSDGKERVVPKKLHYEFEVLGNAHFALTNLFNGNKDLSEAMHKFLNDNWKQVSQEFGGPMIDVTAKKIYKNIGIFFDKNPIQDLTL